jgi:hypothetical protein
MVNRGQQETDKKAIILSFRQLRQIYGKWYIHTRESFKFYSDQQIYFLHECEKSISNQCQATNLILFDWGLFFFLGKQCQVPAPITNGMVLSKKDLFYYNDDIQFTCNHGYLLSGSEISCVFAFFALWKRVKTHVLSDQNVHITHTYCCVSKLSKFGAS